MFSPDFCQTLKTINDGRYNEMENLDIMLNYDNNEFMSSDFFDTIRSVENGIQDDFVANSTDGFLTSSETDGFLTSSETSSHIDGDISPRNYVSESERGSVYNEFNDESVSPSRLTEAIDESLLDFLTPIQINEIASENIQPSPIIVKSPKPSRIIIQNPNNKKTINKQIVTPNQIKKVGKKQILKVQSLTTTNGKSVILPCGLKNIKILNVNDLKTDRIHVTTLPTGNICRRKIETIKQKVTPELSSHSNQLSAVKLTSEEKRLLDKEGINMPAYHPLTKMEDRELKRIRRKIRNKISAQDSRKRKKEYVDGLEERVRRGSEENKNLMQRVKELQKKNKTLMAHISKLQSLIFKSSSSKATPSTCLMIVMLSVLLVSIPNMRLSKGNKDVVINDDEAFSVSRTLLSTEKSLEDDSLNMDEFFIFNKDDAELGKFDDDNSDNENNTENEYLKTIDEIESQYDNFGKKENFLTTFMKNIDHFWDGTGLHGLHNAKGFIEPDIDEYEPLFEPPAKRFKIDCQQNDENFVPLSKVVAVQAGESKDK